MTRDKNDASFVANVQIRSNSGWCAQRTHTIETPQKNSPARREQPSNHLLIGHERSQECL